MTVKVEIERENIDFCRHEYLYNIVDKICNKHDYFIDTRRPYGMSDINILLPTYIEININRNIIGKLLRLPTTTKITDRKIIKSRCRYMSGEYVELNIIDSSNTIKFEVPNTALFDVLNDKIIPDIRDEISGSNIQIKIKKTYCDYSKSELLAPTLINLNKEE